MIFLDRSKVAELLDFVPTIKPEPKCWDLVDISLHAQREAELASVAHSLEEALGARDGAMLVHDRGHILSFVKHPLAGGESLETLGAAIANHLPGYSCEVICSGFTPEGLRKIEIHLSKSASCAPVDRSVLYQHRAARRENVIMLVDEDQYMVRVLQSSLKSLGKCVALRDPARLVEAYLEWVPDIVFLEVKLPGCSGLEVLQSLMKYDRDAHVVVLTGARTIDHVLAAKQNGARGFIGKPFELSRLIREIHACPTITRTVAYPSASAGHEGHAQGWHH